jgi:hypothetical protein
LPHFTKTGERCYRLLSLIWLITSINMTALANPVIFWIFRTE